MNPYTENDLFGISLTPSGSAYLLRLYNMAKWIFILAILIMLLFLADTWIQNKIYARNNAGLNWVNYIGLNIYPIFAFVLSVIMIVQIYFFLHFSRLCNQAIRQQQTDQFNASFKWLFRNTVCACIMFVLELIVRGFLLYGKFWMIQNWQLK